MGIGNKSEFGIPRQFSVAEDKKGERPKITDENEIKKKIERSRAKFHMFLNNKTSKTANFKIRTAFMLMNLDLNDIPEDRALKVMKKLVEDTPGLVITETGDIEVSNSELLMANLGPEYTTKKTLELLNSNPDRAYSFDEVARELGVVKMTIQATVHKLSSEGKIIFLEEELPKIRRKKKLFKIALEFQEPQK